MNNNKNDSSSPENSHCSSKIILDIQFLLRILENLLRKSKELNLSLIELKKQTHKLKDPVVALESSYQNLLSSITEEILFLNEKLIKKINGKGDKEK